MSKVGTEIEVSGWVKTFRSQKSFAFIEVKINLYLIKLEIRRSSSYLMDPQ